MTMDVADGSARLFCWSLISRPHHQVLHLCRPVTAAPPPTTPPPAASTATARTARLCTPPPADEQSRPVPRPQPDADRHTDADACHTGPRRRSTAVQAGQPPELLLLRAVPVRDVVRKSYIQPDRANHTPAMTISASLRSSLGVGITLMSDPAAYADPIEHRQWAEPYQRCASRGQYPALRGDLPGANLTGTSTESTSAPPSPPPSRRNGIDHVN
jgi:hypothetical protein